MGIFIERKGEQLILKNSSFILRFDLNNGFFDLEEVETGKRLLTNAYSEVECLKGKFTTYSGYNKRDFEVENIEDRIGKGKKIRIINTAHTNYPDFYLDVYLYEDFPYIVLQNFLKNNLNYSLNIEKISPLSLSREKGGSFLFEDFEGLHFYKQGWQSWSPSYTLKIGEREDICWVSLARRMLNYDEERKSKKGRYLSEFMTLIGRGKENFIFGFITFSRQFSNIELDVRDFSFRCMCHQEGISLTPQKEIFSEKLLLGFGESAAKLAKDYAGIVKKQMCVKVRDISPSGWCSWYYYFRNIDEEKILANLKCVKEEGISLEYFQVDDGYQKEIGDWLETNKKFKNGMKFIAEKIKEAGFKPGIWIAPFIVRKNSEIYRKNPHWVLKNKKGKDVVAGFNPLWGGFYYALDVSNPEVLQYIREVFRKIKEWGYKFVKIDFVFAGALKGEHYESSLTRCQIYRRAVETIREAVGEDVFILGCGAPLGPSVGVVDGMRISTDVAPFWSDVFLKIIFGEKFVLGCKNALWNTLTRFFLHKNFWINDPDCVLVRKDRNRLNEEEVKSLVSVIGLSGGMVLSSDNFQTLDRERKKLLYLLLPVSGYCAESLDFFKKDFPEVFLLQEGNEKAVSISNWEDKIRDMEISFKELNLSEDKQYHFFEFWSKKYYRFKDKISIRNVSPHKTHLFFIREDRNIPQVIGGGFHILGHLNFLRNEYFSPDLKELYFEVFSSKEFEGEIFIYIPENYKIQEIFTDVFKYKKEFKENILRISLNLKGNCYFKIKFDV